MDWRGRFRRPGKGRSSASRKAISSDRLAATPRLRAVETPRPPPPSKRQRSRGQCLQSRSRVPAESSLLPSSMAISSNPESQSCVNAAREYGSQCDALRIGRMALIGGDVSLIACSSLDAWSWLLSLSSKLAVQVAWLIQKGVQRIGVLSTRREERRSVAKPCLITTLFRNLCPTLALIHPVPWLIAIIT